MSQPLRHDRGVARDPRMRYAQTMSLGHTPRPWEHAGMRVDAGRLLVAGRDAGALAREPGTPPYVYDLRRIGEQAGALREALTRGRPRPGLSPVTSCRNA